MPSVPSRRTAATPPRQPAPARKPSAAKPGPGRPKDPGKRAAVLEAAKRLFLQHGFDGVSMEAIAAEAGVSKLTVYSHYGDKGSLFGQTIRAKCEEMLPPALFQVTPKGSLRRQLETIARAFFALVTSPEAIAMQRLMSALDGADQRLPQVFWEAGPQRIQEGFAQYLRAKADAGQLQIADVRRAASQFFCLLKGEMHARLSCGQATAICEHDAQAHIRATVDMFLRAYAMADTTPRRRKP
ncbi:MAG: TetR/AcrR family transcriptional regulator [Proteobacteria bacterium]|nr:TetR/AcrR family transcriptional regulator [Pseudomonadota bacterium]